MNIGGYIEVTGYEAWQNQATAYGYDQYESPDEFYVVATRSGDSTSEIGGEYDGEIGRGWLTMPEE